MLSVMSHHNQHHHRGSASGSTRNAEKSPNHLTRYSYPEEALLLPYYHPMLATMKEVSRLLNDYLDTSGHFLLRKSFTRTSTLAVSVVNHKVVMHFNISQNDAGIYCLEDRSFNSLEEIFSYYRRQEIPNNEGVKGVYLKHPVLDAQRQHIYSGSSKAKKVSVIRSQKSDEKGKSCSEEPSRRSNNKSQVVLHETISRPAHESRTKVTDCLSDKRRVTENGKVEGRSRTSIENDTNPYQRLRIKSEPRGMSMIAEIDREKRNFRTVPGRKTWSEECDKTSSRRLPCKLPESEGRLPKTEALPYSYVRDPNAELVPSLVKMLREVEGDDSIKCQCGLYHDEAELPRGWSYHRSTDSSTYGKVFFSGPDGETSWNLPLEVSLELSAEQQDRIRELICRPSTAVHCHESIAVVE